MQFCREKGEFIRMVRVSKKTITQRLKTFVWYIHAVEYYSAIIKHEVLICATTGMKLGNIRRSELSQAQVVGFHLYEMSRRDKPVQTAG